ncbi:MAG: endonuclease [Tenericutes bacterium HGW-Tenericutes-6]|nr:MAG: endonuclease [Tenericutes bacterium HGW-Tenericutes-6]
MRYLKWLLILILSVIVLLGLGVLLLTIFEYKPDTVLALEIKDNQTTTIQTETTYSVMTFNIGYAGLGKDEDFVLDGGKSGRPDSKSVVQTYLEGIESTLTENLFDFYLLQEVDLKARRSYLINQVLYLHEALGDDYSMQFAYNFKVPFVPFPLSFTDHIGYVESGLVTFTKYEVTASTRYQFPGAFDWPLRVANLKRAMMISVLDVENSDKDLYIINLHMSAYDGDGSLRAQEMALLQSYLETLKEEGHYVIVGGDFNQTFPEAKDIYPVLQDFYVAYPIEDNFLPLGYAFQFDPNYPSCRLLNQPYDPQGENTQYYIIDGFIVSDNLTILSFDEILTEARAHTLDLGFENSDHNPVVMKFKLNQ